MFTGGFTAEAAETVTGFGPLDPDGVVEILAALTDKSLVQLEDSGRYRLLETIREYAAARLADAGETRAVADRHLGWLVELAEELRPATARSDDTALDRLDARRARGERRRPSFGWDNLTPMEREVVRLAAEGLSNPAIAAKLFVSRSTVKTHLVHVFAKLGVTSRAELAATAVRRGQA